MRKQSWDNARNAHKLKATIWNPIANVTLSLNVGWCKESKISEEI